MLVVKVAVFADRTPGADSYCHVLITLADAVSLSPGVEEATDR